MAAQQQPTNLDLLTELRAMNTRLNSLESWRIAEEAAKKAVSEYKQGEYRDQEQKSIMDVLQKLAPFIVALTALAYAALRTLK